VAAQQQAGQGVQESFRAVQRIDMQRGLFVGHLLVGVNTTEGTLRLCPSEQSFAPLRQGKGIGDDHGTHMPAAQNLHADSMVVTGITPYPACAKTAFRIGVSTLSAEIDRTAGLIVRLSTIRLPN